MIEVFDVIIESNNRLVILDPITNSDLLLLPQYIKAMEARFFKPAFNSTEVQEYGIVAEKSKD